MESELDSFLVSQDGLNQSAHLADTVLKTGESVDGLTAAAQRERFLAEARLLASTGHPNLIRVFGSGSFRGEPYFTMELLRPLPVKMTTRQITALGVLFNTLFDGHAPFLWRILIRRMTSTIPAFRLQSVTRVRQTLLSFKFAKLAIGLALGIFAAILITFVSCDIGALGWGYLVCETSWTELPDSAFGNEQKTPPHVTIKLPSNRKYYLPSLHVNPMIAEVTPGRFTNIPIQFLVVGPGVLKCDSTRWCELIPTNGAQVITGKRFP